MFDRVRHRGWHYLLLSAAATLLFLANLGGASLWDLDEGRNAECAFEMLEAGNLIVPLFNGTLRADKPVLLYWLQIFAYRTLGVHEFSARLPSALAALATVLLCYELGRSLFGKTTAMLAGLIVAATPMLCGAARFANPDALLNLCAVLTLTFFWFLQERPCRAWFALVGASAGLGMLAKGPVGVVFPAAIFCLFLLWQGRGRLLLDRRWWLAFLVMSVVALPWYIWVAVETHGNFLQGFFVKHNLERFASPMESHRGTPLYYPLVLLVGLAPWSIFTAPALWFGFWPTVREPSPRWHPYWSKAASGESSAPYRFLWCWIIVYLGFFTIAATKLPNYVLPVVVPCALLLARFLERWRRGRIEVPDWVVAGSLVWLVLLGAGLGIGLPLAGGAWDLTALRGRTFAGLEVWGLLGLVPVVGAAAGLWCWRRQSRAGLVACVALSALLLLVPLAAYGSAVFNQHKAPQPLVAQVGALRRDAEIRIGCWNLEHLPSLNFYVRRDVLHLHDPDEAAAFLSYPVPAYLFLPADDWEAIRARVTQPHRVVGRHRDMYRHGEIVVVTNR